MGRRLGWRNEAKGTRSGRIVSAEADVGARVGYCRKVLTRDRTSDYACNITVMINAIGVRAYGCYILVFKQYFCETFRVTWRGALCLNAATRRGAGRLIDTGRMSTQIGNIHDAFFKRVLGEPQLAGTFLREHLPAEVAELLGPEPPEPVAGSFVDEDLREHHSDLLFRMRLKEGQDAFTYVLMEHKSTPDRGARLQLLRYVVRILTDWYERNGRRLPLPPVLPLLVHQGPEGWTFSTEFVDLFGAVPEPVRKYLPSFRHALVDLAKVDDEELSREVRLRMFLGALKYSRRSDLNEYIELVLVEEDGVEDGDRELVLTYWDQGPVPLDCNAVLEKFSRLGPKRSKKIMGWLTQPFYEQGKAEGETQGQAKMLIRFLQNRFGVLPESIRQRIFAAQVSETEAWLDRACHAPDLQSVFNSN